MNRDYPLDYWGLKPRKRYQCSKDRTPVFEYRLKDSKLQYRKIEGEPHGWRMVWNMEFWAARFREIKA